MAKKINKDDSRSIVRLLVADENRMNCQLLVTALQRCRGVKVVSCATNSDEVLSEVVSTRPDVALISSNLQDGSLKGFAIVRELHKERPELRTILLLNNGDRNWVIDAFRAGAHGIFCRDDSLSSLCRCIHSVHVGQIWANSAQLHMVLDAFARFAPNRLLEADGTSLLSPREQEVADLVAEGFSNRDVAERLRLSEHTVKNYLFHIFEKLGMSSRVELVLYARAQENVQNSLASVEKAI